MNNGTLKNKAFAGKQNQTLMLSKKNKTNGFSVRLADGESWDQRSVELAMMIVQDTYLDKIHVPQNNTDAGLRMNQVTIRRNHFVPEYEPTRHEMRIFDELDGVVTEM
jgi:hypothetical protein